MYNQVDNTIDSLETNSFKALASTEKPCELLCKENPDDASVILSQNGDESQTFHREAKKRKSRIFFVQHFLLDFWYYSSFIFRFVGQLKTSYLNASFN